MQKPKTLAVHMLNGLICFWWWAVYKTSSVFLSVSHFLVSIWVQNTRLQLYKGDFSIWSTSLTFHQYAAFSFLYNWLHRNKHLNTIYCNNCIVSIDLTGVFLPFWLSTLLYNCANWHCKTLETCFPLECLFEAKLHGLFFRETMYIYWIARQKQQCKVKMRNTIE